MMMREGWCFVILFGQFPQVAVDVVGIAALGFQLKLNGHVFDAEIRCDPVLDHCNSLIFIPVSFAGGISMLAVAGDAREVGDTHL
jgi:hypothetical protein